MAMKAHSRPRGLLLVFLSLLFVFALLAPADATARNSYDYTDSSEGDPGDGVLRPTPDIIIPEPLPVPRTFGIIFTADGLFSIHSGQPNLTLPLLFYGPMAPASFSHGYPEATGLTVFTPQRGWRNAP